jgi:hypothetical protein
VYAWIYFTLYLFRSIGLHALNHLEKEEKSRGITIPDFKTYYKPTVLEVVWFWFKDRHMDLEPM